MLTVKPSDLPFGPKAPVPETEGEAFDTSTSARTLSGRCYCPVTPTDNILTALRALAPPEVAVGVRDIGDWPIFEVERELVKGATQRRRHEFASGRALLRDLMGVDVPIPAGKNRAPVLPVGVCGSLAHDERFVVAAVGSRKEFRSIGIDIEPVDPLGEEIARAVLRADEVELDAHQAFTLKEAAYKAWSGAGGPLLDYHDLRVSILGQHFRAEVLPAGTVLHGVFASADSRWLALVLVKQDSSSCGDETCTDRR
jgi:enterobactin synthetase component D